MQSKYNLIEQQSLFADSGQNIVVFCNTIGRCDGLGLERREKETVCIWVDEIVKIILLKCSEGEKWREEHVCCKWFRLNVMLLVRKH